MMDAESRGWLVAERSDAPANWGFAKAQPQALVILRSII
jgi:hypothetical protein